jgi:hypothetical protein
MTSGSRVLLFSQRNAVARKWHAALYEFEDVIAEVDGVHLLAPAAKPDTRVTRVANRALRAARRPAHFAHPAIRPVQVTGEYDLFFTVVSLASEIPHLRQLKEFRKRCDKAVLFLVELFTDQVEQYGRPYLELLNELDFDEVFLFNPRPSTAVSAIAGSPADFMASGVDAFRFSPYPAPPARAVDLYEFGRHSEVTHAAALDMVKRDGAFFIYDTVFNVPLPDPRPHRELTAELMKRSRYFFAYKASENLDRARADDPLSARYFEGVAGGAVLLGSAPAAPEFAECFDWPDAVIEIPYEAHDLREIVAELDAQPERLAVARANNVANTLRRHDWMYRWEQVLDAAGLPHTAAMAERKARLEQLALAAEEGAHAALDQQR